MANTQQKIDQLWAEIEKAGSISKYVSNTLREKGFMVERRDTDNLSKRELNRYKKELKQEALEKSELKKQAWLAYRANHIVHLGDGIYWSDDNSEDKWDLDNATSRLVENQLPQTTQVKQLCESLELTVSQLRWFCYQRNASTHSHYTRFEIPKRSGAMREIWAPRPKLKKAQRWVNQEIASRLLVHGSAHGFLAGRSIATNAAPHTDSQVIVKLDVENFFPSISWRRVKGVFRKAGYNEQIATLLALLCTESPRKAIAHEGQDYFIALGDRCLPQGAPTSPALTNALCLKMDRRLAGIAKKYGWRYSRYADDLSFSYPKSGKKQPEISHLLGSVQRVMGEEGFNLKHEKTRVIRQGAVHSITGLVVNDKETPRVSRQLKRQMRAAIYNLKQGKPLPEGESLARLRGYAAFITMTDRALGSQMLTDLAEL